MLPISIFIESKHCEIIPSIVNNECGWDLRIKGIERTVKFFGGYTEKESTHSKAVHKDKKKLVDIAKHMGWVLDKE